MAGHGHGQKLSRHQEALIAHLLTCPPIAQAAKASGISEATAGRWLKEPAFLQAYQDARSQLLRHGVAHVAQGLVHGALVLRSILQSDAPPAAKIAAIRLMYDIVMRDREQESLEVRLAQLEAHVATLEAQRDAAIQR
jgi:hypothetical protein